MTVRSHFSTTWFDPATFKPHGTIESKIEGNLFIQEATGPFNKEILLAMDSVHAKARQVLVSNGPWGGLFIFKNSALASPEMLDGLKKYLVTQVARNNASIATGLVLPRSVEGASLMTPHYLRAWRDAGIVCEAFEDVLDAHHWISSQLSTALRLSRGDDPPSPIV